MYCEPDRDLKAQINIWTGTISCIHPHLCCVSCNLATSILVLTFLHSKQNNVNAKTKDNWTNCFFPIYYTNVDLLSATTIQLRYYIHNHTIPYSNDACHVTFLGPLTIRTLRRPDRQGYLSLEHSWCSGISSLTILYSTHFLGYDSSYPPLPNSLDKRE